MITTQSDSSRAHACFKQNQNQAVLKSSFLDLIFSRIKSLRKLVNIFPLVCFGHRHDTPEYDKTVFEDQHFFGTRLVNW